MFTAGTSQTLPAAIAVDELFDGVRYRLPPRQLGGLKWLGLVPILFGAGVAAMALSFALAGAGSPFEPGGDVNWFFFGFLAFTIPFLFAALKLAKIGLYALAGHSEVEMRGGELRAVERVGPLKWIRRRPLESISRFRVISGPDGSHPGSALAATFAGLAGIVAECDSKRKMPVVVAYPQEWLVPLAGDLAARWDTLMPDPLMGATRPDVEVTQKSLDSSREKAGVDQRDIDVQPADSRVQWDEHDDGVTLRVPAAGVFKGSKGLVWFGLLFTAGPSGMLIPAFVLADDTPLVVGLFLLAFSTIGIGILLAAVNMGRRRAVLAVVDDRLMVLQSGLFGAKRREWARDEIEAIGVGPSGLSVNDRPVLELQVKPRQGSKFGILAGRDEPELRWMATTLRRAVQLPVHPIEV